MSFEKINPEIKDYTNRPLTKADLLEQKQYRDNLLFSQINPVLLLNPNKLLSGGGVDVSLSFFPGNEIGSYHKPTWKTVQELFDNSKNWELSIDYEKEIATFKLTN